MPKAICKKCNESYPLQLLTNHIKSCSDDVVVEDENDSQDESQHEALDMECENKDNKVKNNEQACCPICQEEMPFDILEVHASECGESPVNDDSNNTAEFSFMDNKVNNTAEFSFMGNDWKTHIDPKIAALLYRKEILRLHETGKPLSMCVDLRSSPEEQDRQLINFYKQRNVEWACPVKCQLQGDAAIGDGVSRHFFSTVMEKLKYGFSLNLGLSRAFVHVLLHGSQDTATIQLEDCPDVDIRETINLLSGQSPLNEDEYSKVLELCLSWDLPGPTDENRRWLYERLLSHTMLLSHISWPTESDSEDDEYSADTMERITGYLRQFIETASAKDLKNLLKFCVGWERMEANMAVEIVKSDLPKSSTCFCVLRLPRRYNDLQSFTNDLMMCIGTCKYGFGHV
ncbi:G2 M phase-specific E3 ubiquitin- ligase-like protein [Labeo rohita]|uniref:G2 M phase-specific E3 ubiquitin-ligase-like protein n=1 Tax=Labeo rohita TaxID=84645 RepID=A0A498M2H1_LABRO|nr:G2 M phase-specific E3 ubiquitin- ligase-like protein [Labeo rohita]